MDKKREITEAQLAAAPILHELYVTTNEMIRLATLKRKGAVDNHTNFGRIYAKYAGIRSDVQRSIRDMKFDKQNGRTLYRYMLEILHLYRNYSEWLGIFDQSKHDQYQEALIKYYDTYVWDAEKFAKLIQSFSHSN